jgi:predicted peptidase
MRFAAFTVCVLAATAILAAGAQERSRSDAGLSSEELAKLPQAPGAKGDQQRHYFFAAADAEMPYRLYVPQSYDPARKTPLVVALHGYGGDQNYFFAQLPTLPELLERHGFIFVVPMGYSKGGWYGAPLDIPGNRPRNSGQAIPPVTQTPEEMRHERALSEADVMNVLEIVSREYNVDPDRVYLMGHSMGGMGTYVLGQKYAERWAAIAPMSGTLADATYSLDRLANVAVMLSAGSTETATVAAAQAQVEQMKKMGIVTGLWIEPGGTHGSMIAPTLPKVLDFFADKVRR